MLVVAAAIDAGDAHPQFAAGVGAVGFRQHAVQQVPDLALRRIAGQHFVAHGPDFLEGAEAQYLHFDPIALHVDAGGEQLHRVRDTLRAVILATTQQRRPFDGFLRRLERLAQHGVGPHLQQRRVVFRHQKLLHDIGQRHPWRQQARDMEAGDADHVRIAGHPLPFGDGVVAIGIGPDRATGFADIMRRRRQVLAVGCLVPAHIGPHQRLRMAAGMARHLIVPHVGCQPLAPDRAGFLQRRRAFTRVSVNLSAA